MSNNNSKQFWFFLLFFFAISLGLSYFTTDLETFKTPRNLFLSFIKALIFTIVFAIVLLPKNKKE